MTKESSLIIDHIVDTLKLNTDVNDSLAVIFSVLQKIYTESSIENTMSEAEYFHRVNRVIELYANKQSPHNVGPDIQANMDTAVICGQTVLRPERIPRSTWLGYWERKKPWIES